MNSFWNNNHELSATAYELHKIVIEKASDDGSIKGKENKALENYRKAANAYYDMFNNGGMNKIRAINSIFGISKADINISREFKQWERLMIKADPIIANLVLAAAEEQKVM